MRWPANRYAPYLALFGLGLAVFGAVSGSRLLRQSGDPHFALLADAWLNGRLDIDPAKKKGDDWATVETARLDDGTEVRGRRMKTRRAFLVAGGEEIPMTRVERITGRTYHVSFPPLPAVLLLPQAAFRGPRANDVVLTVLIAALILPLALAVLRRLDAAGLAHRSRGEQIWLVVALAFGTVLFFSAVQGRVWYTAHVVGVALTLCYVWCSVEARHPVLAGLCLGLATMTRTPLAFMFPLFAFEAWRVAAAAAGGDRAAALRGFAARGARFAAPVVVIAVAAMIYNHVRFDAVTEFGHRYLDVRQQRQMETTGLFSYHYLSRNLAVALALLPDVRASAPYVSISGHGLAIWFTTPLVLYALWPREKGPLHRGLWLTVAAVALPSLLYQNSGWFQFGYRFSLDYLVFLLLLVAVGGRPLTRVARSLIVVAVVINLFGALTFARDWRFYRGDAATYNTVIEH